MTITEIREICLTYPGVTEDIKWGDHLCFNVGGKMFIVTAPDNVPVSASFKTSDEDFDTLPNREGFIPAPYMARNKWIYVDDIKRFSKKDWENHLRKAYDLIFSKLPQRHQNEIESGKKISQAPPKKRKAVARNKSTSKKKSTQKKKSVGKKNK